MLGLGYRSEADLGGMVLETLLAEGAIRYRDAGGAQSRVRMNPAHRYHITGSHITISGT